MKHLIALGLKYVRRQKLRTLLTFLCVTLSVFILCSFGAYCGSIVRTMRNQEVREFGLWEADVRNVLTTYIDRGADPKEAYAAVGKHAVVDKYYEYYGEIVGYSFIPDDRMIEFDDGKGRQVLSGLSATQFAGDPELETERMIGYDPRKYAGEGYAVSDWLKDRGYKEGDTLNFTVRSMSSVYDEDSDVMKELRRELEEEYGTPYTKYDPEYEQLDRKERRKACQKSIRTLLEEKGLAYEDLPLKDVEYYESYTYSMKIESFVKSENNQLALYRMGDIEPMFDGFVKTGFGTKRTVVAVTFNKDVDFDDALMQFCNDFGYTHDDFAREGPSIHLDLLMFELRSAYAISSLVGYAIVFAFFLLMFWAVARFVIDNAFEISASERSTQYAALRIMGASKAQIAAVVFTEAVFYIVTAVPIGAISAYLLCNTAISRFRDLGYVDFEFDVNPMITLLVVALCVIAVFISAFTSSMWATRKLSPAEAMNFGKPKRKKRFRTHRSKLRISSKRFISRYTRKNIMRSKNRFIIASITMTIGVTLFTSAVLSAAILIKPYSDATLKYTYEDFLFDYDYDVPDREMLRKAEDAFVNKKLFARSEISTGGGFFVSEENNELLENLDQYMKYHLYGHGEEDRSYVNLYFIGRKTYENDLEPLTKLSYDELLKSGGGLLVSDTMGSPRERWNEEEGDWVKDPKYKAEAVIFDKPVEVGEWDGRKYFLTGTACHDIFGDMIVYPIDSELPDEIGCGTIISLVVNGSENYDEAKAVIDDFISQYKPRHVEDFYSSGTGFLSFVIAIAKTIFLLIFSVWAVGVLSMVNSVNTSVLNRSRELMMLRSVGMTRQQLRKTVFQESLMFSSVSSIGGVLLGFAASVGIAKVLDFMKLLKDALPMMIMITAVIIALNVIIAILAAIPGVRSLARAEALTRAE